MCQCTKLNPFGVSELRISKSDTITIGMQPPHGFVGEVLGIILI
jgi:hypothetical protein